MDDEIKDEILPEISSTSAKGEKREKLKLKLSIRKERQRRAKAARERDERKLNAAKEERLLNKMKQPFWIAQTRELKR